MSVSWQKIHSQVSLVFLKCAQHMWSFAIAWQSQHHTRFNIPNEQYMCIYCLELKPILTLTSKLKLLTCISYSNDMCVHGFFCCCYYSAVSLSWNKNETRIFTIMRTVYIELYLLGVHEVPYKLCVILLFVSNIIVLKMFRFMVSY